MNTNLISEVNRLQQELDTVKQRLRFVEKRCTFEDIVGCDPELLSIIQTAKSAAPTPASILIEGERGTGKTLLAQSIHNTSRRWTQSFIKADCDGFNRSCENELHGLIESANRGTLFLANVDRLSAQAQIRVLEIMASRQIVQPGSTEIKKIDVRFLSSSEVDLRKLVHNGSFSKELFERLAVFHLRIPSLRERKNDIELIVGYLINQYNALLGKRIGSVSPAAVKMLNNQEWPGNIRQLKTLISKTIVNMDDAQEQIDIIHFVNTHSYDTGVVISLDKAVAEAERAYITSALARNGGDKNKAAIDLDIPLRTLYYKCKKLGIA